MAVSLGIPTVGRWGLGFSELIAHAAYSRNLQCRHDHWVGHGFQLGLSGRGVGVLLSGVLLRLRSEGRLLRSTCGLGIGFVLKCSTRKAVVSLGPLISESCRVDRRFARFSRSPRSLKSPGGWETRLLAARR